MQNVDTALRNHLAPAELDRNFQTTLGKSITGGRRHSPKTNDYQAVPSEHRAKRIRKILVPTDFSTVSYQAVECAIAVAHQCDAALAILHVIDISAQPAPSESDSAEPLMKRLWANGAKQMAQLTGSLCEEVDAETILKQGLPWEEIVKQSEDADLVIIGKPPGKTGWRVFSQRTAERVIENAACPVTVVRPN